MIYDQTVNPLRRDLLWGVSIVECAKGRKDNVGIKMVHALAKVKISFDSYWGEIGTVKVSAYKTGCFPRTLDGGVPDWDVDDKTNIDAFFGFHDLIKDGIFTSVTVFILPGKITGLQMWDYDGNPIDASEKIQQYTFKAGKAYNLTISKGVQKKNTNSRSIAMSVRCVSE